MVSGGDSFEPLSLPLEAYAFYCLSPINIAGFKRGVGWGQCGVLLRQALLRAVRLPRHINQQNFSPLKSNL